MQEIIVPPGLNQEVIVETPATQEIFVDGALRGEKGEQGLQGVQGPAGATGPAGPQGATGDTGLTGDTGPAGADGADGSTVLNGTGAPDPGDGANGDFYIDTTANEIYGPKTLGDWGSPTSLIGPEGPEGPQGPQGDVGPQGPAGADGTGTGDVVGPASATDNALARFDGTTGKLIQQSIAILTDAGDLTIGKLLKLNATSGNPEMDFQESGTTRGKIFYDVTNNQLVLQNSENGNDDAIYMADPLTVLGPIVTKQIVGGNTSSYKLYQDSGDLLILQRTGDTTGDGDFWTLLDLQSPQIGSDTADSEATISLTTRNGTPSLKARTFDLYNDEYSRDNGMGFRQLYKNTTPNPIRFEFHDKTTNNGAWTMSGATLTNGSPNGSYTSVSGVTPSAEDWIWDNAGTYLADDTKIVSIDTTAKTFVLNRNATASGSGLSIRGKNIKEIMRITPLRQLLIRKFIAGASDTALEVGGKARFDAQVLAAEIALTNGSLYKPNGTGRTDLGYTTWNDGSTPWGGAMEFYSSAHATLKGNVQFFIGNGTDTSKFTISEHSGDNSYAEVLALTQLGVLTLLGVQVPTVSSAHTFTNKRITKRKNTVASSATPAINVDTTDIFTITALAANITSMTSGLTGTPTDGQELWIRIKDNGTARTITWGASFQSSGVATLLATTVINKTHLSKFMYDADVAKWVLMAVDATGY